MKPYFALNRLFLQSLHQYLIQKGWKETDERAVITSELHADNREYTDHADEIFKQPIWSHSFSELQNTSILILFRSSAQPGS
jgi:hypothetical protein